MKHVRVIFNPMAAGGRSVRLKPNLKACLQHVAEEANIKLEWTESQEPGHATILAEEAVTDGNEQVVAIGGDGLINEIVNGLLRAGATPDSTTLGIVPTGSGNDFAWFAGISLDCITACQQLFTGRTRVIDLGHIREFDGRERYFCNGCGAGFDAQVTLEVERFKWLRGIFIYLVPLLKTLILHHNVPLLRIQLDEREWTQRSMMITIGNGRRLGRGFLVTPHAELDDGLFDVCICGELSRLGILMIIPRFMRGTHVTHKQVQIQRSGKVLVEAPLPMPVHLDGEIFAEDARRFEITLIPNALRLSL